MGELRKILIVIYEEGVGELMLFAGLKMDDALSGMYIDGN